MPDVPMSKIEDAIIAETNKADEGESFDSGSAMAKFKTKELVSSIIDKAATPQEGGIAEAIEQVAQVAPLDASPKPENDAMYK